MWWPLSWASGTKWRPLAGNCGRRKAGRTGLGWTAGRPGSSPMPQSVLGWHAACGASFHSSPALSLLRTYPTMASVSAGSTLHNECTAGKPIVGRSCCACLTLPLLHGRRPWPVGKTLNMSSRTGVRSRPETTGNGNGNGNGSSTKHAVGARIVSIRSVNQARKCLGGGLV